MSLTVKVSAVRRAVEVNVVKTVGQTVEVVRVVGRVRTPARLAWAVQTDVNWVGFDYEAPLDVPVAYEAIGLVSQEVTLPSNGRDWLVALGLPAMTRAVNVESFPELGYTLGAAKVQPLTRRNPIPVLSARHGGTGTLTLLTLTGGEEQALITLLDRSPAVMLTGPPANGLGAGLYLLAGDYVVQRTTRVAQEPSRRFIIAVQEIDRPPLEVRVPDQNTWGQWKASGATWDDWASSRTYLDLLVEVLP